MHATGQVVAFNLHKAFSLKKLQSGLNAYLPDDIAVRAVYETPLNFDPRRHAVSRVYRYIIQLGEVRSPLRSRFVYEVKAPINTGDMSKALSLIEGNHDFAPFSGRIDPGKSTRRSIFRTLVHCEGPEVHVEIEGNAFLPQQIRRTVGALIEIGSGKKNYSYLKELVDHGEKGDASWVIPAKGLCLVAVRYQGFPPDNYAD